MLSIIELLQLHAVVIDHTIAGDCPSSALNEQDSSFDTVQIFQLLHTGTAAVKIHIVLTPDFL